MLFKRKGSLKREYDHRLLKQIQNLKKKWQSEKKLFDHSIEQNNDEIKQRVKLAELKYFYLFKEAKARNLQLFKKGK